MADLSAVFTPGRIGRLALPHRIVMGAMHLGLEAREDGGAALAAFYVERAHGEAGLMVTGGAAVSAIGAGGPRYGVLSDPRFRARLRRVVEQVHAAGGLIALQLFHAGRYAPVSEAGTPLAPSAVYSRFSRCEPLAMTGQQVRDTIDDFARGAVHAAELGFDAVEVMGSEGYLIDQFLSPLTNLREDEWGGDATRRARFGVEVTRAVRAALAGSAGSADTTGSAGSAGSADTADTADTAGSAGSRGSALPVIVRFTGLDLIDGGTERADVLAFARALAEAGADALNVGVGWHESTVPSVQAMVPPGVWAPVAAEVKAALAQTAPNLPVIASNRVNRLELAEAILTGTPVDFISMARPFLADPDLIAAGRRGRAVNICIACNQACIDRSLAHHEVSCMVNPRAARESVTRTPRTTTARRIAVIGGGPAGLQAARQAALAGHQVELFEAGDTLGGQFRLARKVPGKADYGSCVDYFSAELARLGVRVRLERGIGPHDLDLLRSYDGVIVASGVRPRPLELPGVDLPHVLDYSEAFADGALRGRVVIIGGGGIAADVAQLAVRAGVSSISDAERFRREHGIGAQTPAPVGPRAEVTVLHRGARLAARTGASTRWAVLAELRGRGVRILTGVRCHRITAEGVLATDAEGGQLLAPADTVVVAVGQLADGGVAELVRQAGVWHRVIGGARDATGLDAVRAFAEGYAAAAEIDQRGTGTLESVRFLASAEGQS